MASLAVVVEWFLFFGIIGCTSKNVQRPSNKNQNQNQSNISVFEKLVKKFWGSPNFKVASEYQGKQTHRTVAIGLRYFELATRKNIIKSVSILNMKFSLRGNTHAGIDERKIPYSFQFQLVRSNIRDKCKMYGSIRRKQRLEEMRQEDTDYNDSGDETEEGIHQSTEIFCL